MPLSILNINHNVHCLTQVQALNPATLHETQPFLGQFLISQPLAFLTRVNDIKLVSLARSLQEVLELDLLVSWYHTLYISHFIIC